ncbi:reverse transcriptase domain-containing protein, partial [Tanacetum coccineum]
LENTHHIPRRLKRGSKYGPDSQQKGKANSDQVCQSDTSLGREKLRPFGKIGIVLTPLISKITESWELITSVKCQVLADFLNEVPVKTKHLEICSLTNDEDLEEWTLFNGGASSLKGAGVGLILIDPRGTEYTYTIRMNFTSTNSEAEYKALLAGLRIA